MDDDDDDDDRGAAVVDSKRTFLVLQGLVVWNGLRAGVVDGRVDGLKKRRWIGFDVAGDDDAVQHGVRSTGCNFMLVSAERRCIE